MQNTMKYRTDFNVFGIRFSVYTVEEIDKKWIEFILRDYEVPAREEMPVSIFLPTDKKSGFMKSHLNNGDVKGIYIKNCCDNEFQWQSSATPIPPFLIPPYLGRYVLLHGCGVCDEQGNTTLILGDSMTGKTYLSLLLLQKGYKLVTDDLIVFDIESKCIVPYSKPIGLRENTISLDTKLKEFVEDVKSDKLVFLSKEGKRTWLVHIDDIYDNIFAVQQIGNIKKLIVLGNNENIERVSFGDLIRDVSSSVINSGVGQVKALEFLCKFLLKNVRYYKAPVHDAINIAKFILEEDNNV